MVVDVVVSVGALLVVTGIALTFIQLLRRDQRQPPARGMTANFEKFNVGLKTTFPGLILAGLGVVLEVASVIAS